MPVDSAPQVTHRAAQPYAGISASVTMAAIGSVADRIPEIFGWLAARNIAPAGPPFFRYHVINMERQLVVEAGVPVATPVEAEGDVAAGTLPAGEFAVMTHTGAPDTLMSATSDLLAWGKERGLDWDVSPTDAGDSWGCRVEFYLTNPAEQPDPSTWQTQLAFRLANLVNGVCDGSSPSRHSSWCRARIVPASSGCSDSGSGGALSRTHDRHLGRARGRS
jgi:effector-binding domain-containing protein